MNDFFGTAFSQEDLERRRHSSRGQQPQQNAQLQGMQMAGPGPENVGMGMNAMVGGDTLDDIIMQNNNEIQRQQSLQQSYPQQGIDRRQSMMEYGSNNGGMNTFGFGSSMTQDQMLRRQSAGQVDMNNPYPDMDPGMNMGQQMGYQQATNTLSMDVNGQYSGMAGNMGMMGYGSMGMDVLSDEDTNALNMFTANNFAYPTTSMGPIGGNYMSSNMHSGGFSRNQGNMGLSREDSNDMMPAVSMASSMMNSPQTIPMSHGIPSYASPVSTEPSQTQSLVTTRESTLNPSRSVSRPTIQESETPPPKPEPKTPNYTGIYSQSGFDMLGALMKVATRANAEIDIGKVDMSCAFVVCDITLDDCPIIYVSDIFERLTGYTKFEVLGRNCRFLQSPEGRVQGGAHRQYVDNDSVYYLKNRISSQKEAQRSLINYRKGGQPFMNLLTMIPITGEDNKEIRYFVGFQVDLVEKPTSVEGKNAANGLYTVDYKQGTLPRYVWHPPDSSRPDGGQTVSRDDVTLVLANINSKNESDLTKRMWDKVLLENTDDVVHVLSLKGLFLYLSPSSRKVLEYDSSELVGTALSSVCHPSDIVPVTRELKDTVAGGSVNIVFRFRRKKSGYTWFESHGSLCVEQGKGRKCIILVGRERPVYALFRHDIEAAGGIGEAEIWTKLSTSGMFLYVSSNVKNLLDRSPEDLVGTSIQALMRPESREQFGRSLEKARTGKRTTHKHEIINKRGLTLQAQTTLYPGDASEGQKPTFLVAQTRMLKTNRNAVTTTTANALGTKSLISGKSNASDSNSVSNPASVSPTLSQGELGSLAHPNNLPSMTHAGGAGLVIGTQDQALASEDNIFDELKTTRCTSWQFELRQMEKSNRLLAEELAALLANKKKRKRRRPGHVQRDCANCHTRVTPEWRRGPSGQRDLCNSCGLRWAKQVSNSNSDPSIDTVRQHPPKRTERAQSDSVSPS